MANQPKKYKKFVATAATATLVASAIVPVASAASFTDVPGDHEFNQYINELVEAGIIKGYPDGTFGLYKQLKRSDVVKMLGRYLEANGVEVPADWATVQRFSDVPVTAQDQELVKYAALVKDAGVFTGSNGKLNYTQNIQRQQMAKVLNNAYEKINGKSLIDLAAEIEDVKVADLDKAFDEFRPYIQALADLRITTVENFRPADAVTRGQFAKFLSISIKGGDVTTPTPAEVEIESLTATGVSQLTVKFNKAVDTEAAKFAVARGTTAITVKDIDWNEAKTEAVITVDHKFVDATYTLTVSGLGEKDLTASVTTTKEEVTRIEFLSDKLVFTGRESGDYKEAVIAFVAYNQYGEDITKNVINSRYEEEDVKGIKVAGKNQETSVIKQPVAKDGKFIAWVYHEEDEGEEGRIEFTYVNGDYELDVTHDVVLSEVSEPGSIELFDIYNPSGKTLTTKNLKDAEVDATGEPKEDYYLLFKVKDQYGVEIDPEFAKEREGTSGDTTLLEEVQDGIRVSVSNRDIFDIEDEEKVDVINVDGEWYFTLRLIVKDAEDVEAGENTVEFRAKATGETTSKVYKVEASSEVHKIELVSPDEVVAGNETVKLPVIATDQNGEIITDAAELNEQLRKDNPGITIDADMSLIKHASGQTEKDVFKFIEENGKLYLEFETKPNNRKDLGTKAEVEDLDIEITVEKSDEESEITLKVEPDAYPAKIVGIKDKADTYFHEDGQLTLELSDFLIEDQYGRVFDDVEKLSEHFSIEVTRISAGTIYLDNAGVIQDTEDEIIFKASDNGSASVEFKLVSKDFTENADGANVEDKLNVTLRAVENDDFKSYKVESDGVVFGLTEDDKAGIEVYGVLSNGVEVEITDVPGAFQVLPGDYLKSTAATSEDSVEVVADKDEIGDKFAAAGIQTLETGVRVVINATGEVIVHKITVSEARPKAATIKLKDSKSINENNLEKLNVEITEGVITSAKILEALAEHTFEVKDQYDNKASFAGGKFTFTYDDTYESSLTLTVRDLVTQNDVKVRNNGRADVVIGNSDNEVKDGDYFTLIIAVDGVSKTIRVNAIEK
ncbi:S-layer homology domain-containing protein [Ureibacillus thermosphaericus]|uniref:S-layer homology domain-containing protein n=1 Tax=Ureibacillus thermosphaericus TaxID=51173 RepID=UPI00031A5A27|nr:S-layer homology domain-containing protein [Ureibacillus thermosphaericus]